MLHRESPYYNFNKYFIKEDWIKVTKEQDKPTIKVPRRHLKDFAKSNLDFVTMRHAKYSKLTYTDQELSINKDMCPRINNNPK